jgi:hypothetical protein
MGARRIRSVATIVAAMAIAVSSLVACSSGGSDPGPGPGTTTTTSTSVSTSTTSSGGSPSPCATSGLALSLTGPEGTAGHFEYQIAFRNTTSATCALTGFPGVSFVDAAGTQLGVPVPRSTLPISTVPVLAGGTVTAHLQVTDPSVLDCPATRPAGLRVFPPGQTASATISLVDVAVCVANPGAIDPVVAPTG